MYWSSLPLSLCAVMINDQYGNNQLLPAQYVHSKDGAIPHIVCKEVPKQAESQHAQSQQAQSQHVQSQQARFARETTTQAGTHNPGSQAVTAASSLVNALVMGADQEEDGSTRQGYSDWVTTTQEINGPVLQ